jgi:cytochrome c-type biogenesis protein CcmH/NrfG
VGLDPESAVAAYNLGVIHAQMGRIDSAIDSLRRAYKLQTENPQYGYSLAFYLDQSGNTPDSVDILRRIVRQETPHVDAILLLGEIYLKQGEKKEARTLYRSALESGRLSPEERSLLESRIAALPE